MGEYYYELVVKPTAHEDLFSDFLNDILPVGYEERDGSFIIRLEEEEDPQTVSWGIEQFAEALSKATSEDVEVDISIKKLKNSDWIAEYQKSITPLQIGKFYIHPTWSEPKEDAINIAIDPALAFGTGHHPTTATCLKAISNYVKEGMEVCDVGCGSGILAIAAAKLKAIVDACDTDPLSVENCKKNLKLNDVLLRDIWQGSIDKSKSKYDIIIANIVADVLIFLKKELQYALKESSSLLILSGIMDKYEQKVLKAYSEYDVVERITEDEWVSLVLRKKEN
ncbi:Ribosomal protein L11 methyltransferase [hydrothermal vent metagenome]|uniref:Ribosomal protein L11 methyltransferase n=1 Tax=hydrothermal vent metagenome TaxID=652676 RepID=A0A1W1BRC9_9ZZZZ